MFERERESYFSLDFPSFGLSVRFGTRSKVVLRGEGHAWTPIWWSSENSKRLVYSLAKVHFLDGDLLRPRGRVIGLKRFEPNEEISNCVAVNSANQRVSLFT